MWYFPLEHLQPGALNPAQTPDGGGDLEEVKAEQQEKELVLAPGFNMEDAEAEFVVAQASEMAQHIAILESIQDEAYAETNRQFIRQERATTDALFDEVQAEMDADADAEEPEVLLPPKYPVPAPR